MRQCWERLASHAALLKPGEALQFSFKREAAPQSGQASMRNAPARLGLNVGIVWYGFDMYLYPMKRGG